MAVKFSNFRYKKNHADGVNNTVEHKAFETLKHILIKNPLGCQGDLWLFWGDVGCHIYP